MQGPTATVISRGKVHQPAYLDPPFGIVGKGVMVFSVNTFVGTQELFENQQELRQTFERFGETFKEEMQRLRAGMIKGLPDRRMVERFGEVLESVSPEDLELLNDTLERFFATPEWKTHAEAHRRPVRFLH